MFTNSGISSPQGLLEMSPSIHPCLSLAQSLITGWLLHPTSKGIQPPWRPALNWCKWAGPIVLLHLLPTYIWNLSICNVPFSSSPQKKESEILLTLFYVFWQFLFQKKNTSNNGSTIPTIRDATFSFGSLGFSHSAARTFCVSSDAFRFCDVFEGSSSCGTGPCSLALRAREGTNSTKR